MLLITRILYFVFFLFFGIFLSACQIASVHSPVSQATGVENQESAKRQQDFFARLKESQAQMLSYEIVVPADWEKEEQAARLAERIVRRSRTAQLKTIEPPSPPDPQSVYQKALSTLLSGDALSARVAFTDFQKKWPDSFLMPNVLYWLGETYYSREEYIAALLGFKKVWEDYPDHPKAADAMLKAAYSCLHLKNTESAKLYLETVLRTAPHSRTAVLALCKLRTL